MHTAEVKEVGKSIGQHAPLAAGHAVAQELLWISAERLASLCATHPDVDACLTATHRGWVQPCITTFNFS